ncbi:hypothetical protein UFOVP1333_38 [uncultured Caudovirales phage]|uniref:Uncharacterized protein n=1 Tax=uncultured Caudovirales phage TaxID=2100421 RepID=A0A6J5RPL8_9CAUD|nr:hypothetical protein UFOVP1333_38 [uncultured Caudovirales phage]
MIHPRAFARPFPPRTEDELLAAAHLLKLAAERPEKRGEIVETVADYLASLGRPFDGLGDKP